MEILIPKISVSIFRVRISTLVERSKNFKDKKKVERKISFHRLDSVQNNFELCPTYTASNRIEYPREKMRRRKAPMIGQNPRRIQIPKGFSTLRVALSLPIQIQVW